MRRWKRRLRSFQKHARTAGLVLGAGLVLVVAILVTLRTRQHFPPAIPSPALPEYVRTTAGVLHVENEYLPGVVDCEIGPFTAAAPALEAQAIAARTYLARYLAARGTSGAIPIGPSFQCWRKPVLERSVSAARASYGLLMRWNGQLVNGNFVAGAAVLKESCRPPPPPLFGLPHLSWEAVLAAWRRGKRFENPAWTQVFVTDNRGRRGAAVIPTALGSWGPPNRGAMGQHAAICLAERGLSRLEILRSFYGEDIELSR